ncbi:MULTISPECIES: ABC transporter permease [unclassified Variovorax]|uniref:ABC transporter permease n=1 Tax=unclassified Variovorax TaxID=663243 RepID=UPI00076C4629|nr:MULTISPECIES: ABC transporter permease [unclassified Variovorax]KWT97274.1 Hydroxymethylpyrimidine ABC transporter, transmembrane component [Variovorax sp. WDL1]PNG56232.1 putative aliphatic sulfonates transport permease protein SsuC [Variovorax sp. B4]PNG57656.1 putative aliphatic sulfonates transport permease protein SsuC [Variovorax sp. B2]VTV09925.1 Putative aliphatic sulfonates transport permease protein SsuC [Variovorax sp. WDL1]
MNNASVTSSFDATTPAEDEPAAERPALSWLGPRPELPLSALLFIVVVGGWELAVRLLEVTPLLLPTPSAVAASLWEGIRTNTFTYHLGVTFYETIAGFALGAGLGLVLGAVIAQFPLVERTLYPYVVAFQTIPKVAIAPLFVIWFGYGMSSKIVITATIAFFPVLANTVVGLRSVPSDQLELLKAFTASRWQVFRMARIPHALPFIFVGLDVSIVLSVIGAIVGEFVGAQAGLGYLILQRTFSMDTAGMFAILILLSAMGLGLHWLVHAVQRKVVFWAEDERQRISGA